MVVGPESVSVPNPAPNEGAVAGAVDGAVAGAVDGAVALTPGWDVLHAGHLVTETS